MVGFSAALQGNSEVSAYRNIRRQILRRLPWSVLVAALLPGGVGYSQDVRVAERYPGVSLSRRLPGADTELYLRIDTAISSRAQDYSALVYYQRYPAPSRERYTSYALLNRVGDDYRVVLDVVAADSGAFDHELPVLYESGGVELVAFSSCYRGCMYSFFRLDDQAVPIGFEEYTLSDPKEYFGGRGDVYRFEPEALIISRRISREGDAACCPSGGKVDISYVLAGDTFRIGDVTRTE